MKFERLHDGIADHDQAYALINRGYSAKERSAGQWFETTAEIYATFLNILPPMDFTADGFSMSEYATGTLTDAFVRHGGRFFYLSISRERASDFSNAVRAFLEHLAGVPEAAMEQLLIKRVPFTIEGETLVFTAEDN